MSKLKVIISGGGTGGHIYPAIAIANAIKEQCDAEILFVGAEGRMEMEKVPEAGYKIIGLPIQGLQRSLTFRNIIKNLQLPFKLMKSMSKAKKIVKDFKPDVAIGVGGYASGPMLFKACKMGVPALVQEQNGFAGKTNIILSKKVQKICVAYEQMDKFFPKEKIVFTGNPVRKDILDVNDKREEACRHFGLSPDKKIILNIGGSLGARTLNNGLKAGYKELLDAGYQLLWQTGKNGYQTVVDAVDQQNGLVIKKFIKRMDLAYACADVVISRAGALSVSELCLVAKAAVLVPSPNVAEDHQTKNAMALVNKGAALMVKDVEVPEKLIPTVLSLLSDEAKMTELSNEIIKLGRPDAANEIAGEVLKLVKK